MKTSLLLMVLLACAAIASAALIMTNGSETDKEATYLDVSEPTTVNSFSWDVFDSLDGDEIFYSSYGLYTALAMLLNGAEPGSTTEKELLDILHKEDCRTVNSDIKKVLDSLTADTKYRFGSSNLILVDKTYVSGKGISSSFSEIMENMFKGSVRTADIRNDTDAVKEMIRGWVSDSTYGFIPDYASILDSSTLADVLNVVYFKGEWVFRFENTFDGKFRCSDGSASDVKMMQRTFSSGAISYYTDGKYRGVSLPYESDSGSSVSMIIILPADGGTDIKSRWSAETVEYREKFIENVRNGSLDSKRLNVIIPKLDVNTSYDLKELFTSLGLNISMSDAAEFTKIIDDDCLKITDGKHQAKLKVDETGTEAAAVTEVVMKNTSVLNIDPVINFHCDIPFIFTISEEENGIDLFTGYIGNLKSNVDT